VTDHFIQSRPLPQVRTSQAKTLVAVGGEASSGRDLGLAYAQVAARGDVDSGREAQRLLQAAESAEQAAAPPVQDADLHTELGFLDLAGGDRRQAAEELESALRADPVNTVAAGNLAVLLAQAGQLQRAVELWQMVAKQNPAEVAAGINLAMGSCMIGNRAGAMAALERVLKFSPDDSKARAMLQQIAGDAGQCGLR
jgi:tetratricopeptide (TPR) repeat protein